MRYRWFPKGNQEQEKQQPKAGFSHGEKAGLVLFAGMLCWGLSNGDLPMVFFGLAFIIYELRFFAKLLGPGLGSTLSNLMQGFSIALAVGALVWVLL